MTASRPGVTIIPIHGHTPRIHDSAFIAPGCTIIGNVEIGADSSVWYNCVLRADVSRIVIGERSNIQDGSVCHCDPERPGDPGGSPLIIGDDVLVGHMAMVHGCTIEDRGFVGLGAIAMNKAVIGSDAMLAAGAMLTEGKVMAGAQDARSRRCRHRRHADGRRALCRKCQTSRGCGRRCRGPRLICPTPQRYGTWWPATSYAFA